MGIEEETSSIKKRKGKVQGSPGSKGVCTLEGG